MKEFCLTLLCIAIISFSLYFYKEQERPYRFEITATSETSKTQNKQNPMPFLTGTAQVERKDFVIIKNLKLNFDGSEFDCTTIQSKIFCYRINQAGPKSAQSN